MNKSTTNVGNIMISLGSSEPWSRNKRTLLSVCPNTEKHSSVEQDRAALSEWRYGF